MATSKRTALSKQVEEPADFEEVIAEPADFKDEVGAVVAQTESAPRTAYVGPSDTWATLAEVHRVSAADLAAANGMTIHSYLYAGRELTIP